MSSIWKGVTAACGAAILATGIASPASAGCVDPPSILSQRAKTPLLHLPGHGAPAYDEGQRSFGRDSDEDDATIVGLWQFAFISDGNNVFPFFIPDKATLDAGYAQWHSDQTEIMNSGRDPATSNFCLGTWKKVGRRKYQLNHFALTWDNTGKFCTPEAGAPSCFVGPTNIRETIVLDRHGNAYSGSVTIDQYDPDNQWKFRLTGNVSAQRITAD